jgi:hypothetical protein
MCRVRDYRRQRVAKEDREGSSTSPRLSSMLLCHRVVYEVKKKCTYIYLPVLPVSVVFFLIMWPIAVPLRGPYYAVCDERESLVKDPVSVFKPGQRHMPMQHVIEAQVERRGMQPRI